MQADARFRNSVGTGQTAEGPQHEGRHGAARVAGDGEGSQRAADAHALQHAPARSSTGRPRGHQLGRRRSTDAEPGRGTCRATWPTSGPRWPSSNCGRQHRHDHLRLRRGDGVPGPGGPVRKLVAAPGGDPRRADVPAQLLVGVAIAHMDVNIFTQIGFVVLVGLASKNAILIVEFAKRQRQEDLSPRGHAGGLPAAAAADHHDLVRLHSRRVAIAGRHAAPARRCGARSARRYSAACWA